jgi:hypothetical protein
MEPLGDINYCGGLLVRRIAAKRFVQSTVDALKLQRVQGSMFGAA